MPNFSALFSQDVRHGLPIRIWTAIAAAFGTGLLLFLIIWLDQRNDDQFFRPEPNAGAVQGQVFEPLPVPMPGSARSASGMGDVAEEAARARHEAAARPAPPPPVAAPERPADAAPPGETAHRADPASGGDTAPVAISKPAPDYPGEAVRRGETGKVVVRIEVGADGRVDEVSLARSSRSRSLDRAALSAARQWRFRPAQENGRPVAGSVEVPFDFTLESR